MSHWISKLLQNYRVVGLVLVLLAGVGAITLKQYAGTLKNDGLEGNPEGDIAMVPESESGSPPEFDPNNPMQQIQMLRARLDQNPNDEEALMALGNANLMIKRFDDAAPYYEHLITVNPNQLDARSNLASIRLEQGNVEDARSLLEKNLELSPNDATTLFNLGVVYVELNDFQQAIKTWEQWLALNPASPIAGSIAREIEALKAKS